MSAIAGPFARRNLNKPVLILVGGFLGAGKTTLLAAVARALRNKGKRAGLVTNDQAENPVDTAALQETGSPVREVNGGCFCCRFPDLVEAMERLVTEGSVDVLLGESVGSCTDLSATVLQPLKAEYRGRYTIAPASVLVDPDRVRPFLALRSERIPGQFFPENVDYIYRKQLEGADIIGPKKIDLLSAGEQLQIEAALQAQFPRAQVKAISARKGIGVDTWLATVLGDG